jgi:4-hydroxybenzoate polyprenyltransferase
LNSYLARMRAYLREMFPVGRHFVLSLVTYIAVAMFARRVQATHTSVWTSYLLLGTSSYFLVPLMLRLMDELKDRDIDAALFAARPLPSGRVRVSDIRWSLVAVIVLFLGINAVHRLTLFAAAMITGYALLMFRRFFAEKAHRDSLPLTLATHNPIVPLSLSYGFFLFAAEHDLAISALHWAPILVFIVMLWMPMLSWEFSRKIRAPEQEDAYVTYSRLLGPRGAAAAMLIVQFIGLAASAALCVSHILPWAVMLLPAAAWMASLWAARRYLRRLDRRSAALRPFAEAFALATTGSVLLILGTALA